MLAQVLFMFADALFQDHAVPTTVALDFNYEHAVSVDGIPSSLHILMKSSTSQTTQWELNRAVRLVQPDSGEEEDAEMTGDSGELENLRLLGAAARLASTLGAQIRPPTEEETYLAGEDFTSGMVVLTLPNVDVPELTAANAILAAMVRHPPMQTASSQDTPNQFLLAAPLTRANMASSLFGDDNSRYQSAEVLLMATASSAGDETADGYPRLSNTSTHNKRPSMSAANSASGFFANYTDMDELDERKLLVVEDNTINQRIISAFLSSIGFHHVTYAADGADALMHYNDSVASGAPFDVIFMDEGLPTLSGTSMAQHIRQRSGDSMQVIISVSASPDFAADAEYRRVCGYDDAIVKPVTKEALRLMLEKWGPNGLGRKERLASLARLGVLLVDDMGLGL
ncbi:CheY-like superfamily [Blastocladiella britannica]|nr:CheY-like superfamily [Blastocladiella britannica]